MKTNLLRFFAACVSEHLHASDLVTRIEGLLKPHVILDDFVATVPAGLTQSTTEGGKLQLSGMREGDHKIMRQKKTKNDERQKPLQLFNLATDIAEKTDLSESQPDQLKRLEASYQEWNAQLIEPNFQSLTSPQ